MLLWKTYFGGRGRNVLLETGKYERSFEGGDLSNIIPV